MFENKNKIHLTVPRKLLCNISTNILGIYTYFHPVAEMVVNHPVCFGLQSAAMFMELDVSKKCTPYYSG